MFERDYDRFSELLQGMADYYRTTLTPATFAIYWRSLSDISIEAFERALFAHTNTPDRGSFMPKVADIRAALQAIAQADGHPPEDEAWSIAIAGRDEGSSVVWTDEIANAFLVAAMPLLAERDKVAARMAFLDRYRKNVAESRAAGRPVKWVASLGRDPGARIAAVDQAVARGRLTQAQADKLLPAPQAKPDFKALEMSAAKATDPEAARRQIANLKRLVGITR